MPSSIRSSFRPRGPIVLWNSVSAAGLSAAVVMPGSGPWIGAAVAVAVAGIAGVLMATHRLVVDSESVWFGRRRWPLADVRAIRGHEHRLSKGRPIGLVFDLADGTSVSWGWISYRRTFGGNIMGQDVVGLRDQRYLAELVRCFDGSGPAIILPALSRLPSR